MGTVLDHSVRMNQVHWGPLGDVSRSMQRPGTRGTLSHVVFSDESNRRAIPGKGTVSTKPGVQTPPGSGIHLIPDHGDPTRSGLRETGNQMQDHTRRESLACGQGPQLLVRLQTPMPARLQDDPARCHE